MTVFVHQIVGLPRGVRSELLHEGPSCRRSTSFDVIGLAEIQVLSGYFAVWFQESDEVSTCLTVERKLFEGV